MSNDAQQEFQGREKARFPLLLLVGIVLAVAVVIAAFAADSEYGIPVVILLAICVAAAVGYRVLAGSGSRSDADSSDNVPKQAARSERPLGDTPEAHDEISPHDLPLDNPGRIEAQRESGAGDEATEQGTTRGTSGDSVAH